MKFYNSVKKYSSRVVLASSAVLLPVCAFADDLVPTIDTTNIMSAAGKVFVALGILAAIGMAIKLFKKA